MAKAMNEEPEAKQPNVFQEIRQAVGQAVDELRASPVAQALDWVIDKPDSTFKAWLANGLDELRQAVSLGTEQVHDGNSPGLWGTITTGEATAERLEGSEKKLSSLDDLRG